MQSWVKNLLLSTHSDENPNLAPVEENVKSSETTPESKQDLELFPSISSLDISPNPYSKKLDTEHTGYPKSNVESSPPYETDSENKSANLYERKDSKSGESKAEYKGNIEPRTEIPKPKVLHGSNVVSYSSYKTDSESKSADRQNQKDSKSEESKTEYMSNLDISPNPKSEKFDTEQNGSPKSNVESSSVYETSPQEKHGPSSREEKVSADTQKRKDSISEKSKTVSKDRTEIPKPKEVLGSNVVSFSPDKTDSESKLDLEKESVNHQNQKDSKSGESKTEYKDNMKPHTEIPKPEELRSKVESTYKTASEGKQAQERLRGIAKKQYADSKAYKDWKSEYKDKTEPRDFTRISKKYKESDDSDFKGLNRYKNTPFSTDLTWPFIDKFKHITQPTVTYKRPSENQIQVTKRIVQGKAKKNVHSEMTVYTGASKVIKYEPLQARNIKPLKLEKAQETTSNLFQVPTVTKTGEKNEIEMRCKIALQKLAERLKSKSVNEYQGSVIMMTENAALKIKAKQRPLSTPRDSQHCRHFTPIYKQQKHPNHDCLCSCGRNDLLTIDINKLEISRHAFCNLIKFAYRSNLTFCNVEDALETYKAADRFEMKPLMTHCIKYLKMNCPQSRNSASTSEQAQ
ncbi:hypothetical protein Ciccas_002718 [Cichlidogyrus casuarinus]|uniref:BTB domain-containing protein n=1 Tax=Cichlidogyrus casuarinus TaxID=1844966 RepID=A0ABD2QGV3_9PLAT